MANLTAYEYDIFLSHNHADEDWTATLAERLEQEDWQGRKLKVFFSPWDIVAGQSIPQRIEEALPKSRKVGLIMSPEAMKSSWVKLERLVTTYIAVSERGERLIPLLRRDCEIPALAKPLVYLDFRDDAQFEENYQRLLTIIKDEPTPRRARKAASAYVPSSPSIPRPPVVGFVARRGRDGRDIVERLKEELAPHKNQLIALWGEGGMGKTTLAAEAVRTLQEVFAQRIVWISADGRPDFSLSTLLDEIATQLKRDDLRALAIGEKEAQVSALISEARTLIVLDNFETIAPAEQNRCTEFIALRTPWPALITSRQKVAGARDVMIDAMSPEEAKVFLQKLVEQSPIPQVFTEQVRGRIGETATRNPLVMEWVVAQINLAQQPDDVLNELAQGKGDAAERVFDRSFGLEQLGDDGRAALLALSVFVPDASRPALAEVAGFGDNAGRLNNAVKRIAALRLVSMTAEGSRLYIAGLTRELSKARLANDARAAELRRQFIAYFKNYAEAHAQPTAEDYDALEAERNNLLSALDAAFTHGIDDRVLEMAYMLTHSVNGMLRVRGYWNEVIRHAKQALDAAKASSNEWFVGALANNLGTTFADQGNYPSAKEYYELAVQVARKIGAKEGLSASLHELGRLAQAQGKLEDARRLYDESLDIERSLGNQNGIARSLGQLGSLAQDQGELEHAQRLYNESLEISKRLGDQNTIAITLHELGRLTQEQGELDEARPLYDESLEINKRLGNQSGIAITLHNLATIAQRQGKLEEARRLYDESLEINERLGNQSGIASTLHQLGQLAHKQGELAEARRLYGESLDIEQRLGNRSGIANSLWQLGIFAAQEGDRAEAARLLREALSIFEKLKSPKAEIARRVLARVEDESS